jgi:iron complex outermembrane receptor protein
VRQGIPPNRLFLRASTLLAWLLLCLHSPPSLPAEAHFDIPAQPVNDALTLFAAQAGVSLLFPFNAVGNIVTQRLYGTYTVDQALKILLKGTGLTASVERQVQVVIRADANRRMVSPAPPAAPANRFTAQETAGEIVVTARRREESLQDVPISVTAIGGAELELRNIGNISDINTFLPNVSIRGGGTSAGSEGQFVIRGIPGVARYVDGVVQRAAEGSLINVVELERVEVLRGPQGTLFGKNAIGGAIQYVTRRPSDSPAARLRATFGSFSRRDFVASVDMPLPGNVFTQLTAASLRRDGYVRSDLVPTAYGEQNNDLMRAQLLWRPAENFEALIAVDRSEIDERQQANVLYDVIDSHALVRAYNTAGLPFTDAIHAHGGRQEYRNRSTYTGTGNLWSSRSFSMNLDWRITDRIRLRSVTGARTYRWGNYQDLDASEYAFFEQWYFRKGAELSQEIQLQGNSRSFDWTVGAYYGREQRDNLALRWQYEEVSPRPRSDITQTDAVDLAVFGEGTLRLSRQWAVTVGLRYSTEDFASAVFETPGGRPAWQSISTSLSLGAPVGQRTTARFSSLTPRLTVEYDWNDSVMSYLTYAEGFNGGGINGGAPVNGEFISFDEEMLSQYEIGMRSSPWGGKLRLNASYFHGFWDEIQLGQILVPGLVTTRNTGAARIRGIEVDSTWKLTPQLVVNLSGALLDTRYTRLVNTTTVRLDTKFALAPERSFAIGATYEWPLQSGASLRLRTDYGWVDTHVTTDDYRLQKPQKAYGLLNGRLTYTSASGQWETALFVTNLTDEWYQLGGFSASFGGVDQGVPSRPRESGVDFSFRF